MLLQKLHFRDDQCILVRQRLRKAGLNLDYKSKEDQNGPERNTNIIFCGFFMYKCVITDYRGYTSSLPSTLIEGQISAKFGIFLGDV
jgi:hypothetical protein